MSYRSESIKIFRESMKEKKKYAVDVLDKKFVVYPGVFSPKYFNNTKFFAASLPVKKGDRLLEIGCGTGVVSIFALLHGAASAVCVDINPAACKNTEENARLHGLERRIRVLRGDVFSPLKKEKFDVVFWNIPLNYTTRDISMEERAISDKKYASVEKFFHGVKNYAKPKGRAFIGFSTDIGNMDKLEDIALSNWYVLRLVKYLGSTQPTKGSALPASFQLFQLVESPFTEF